MTEQASEEQVVGLQPGERAPDMVLPDANGTPVRWYGQAGGKPGLVVVADADSSAVLADLGRGLSDRSELTVHVIGPSALNGHTLDLPLLQDDQGRAATAFRTQGQPTAFLLDPNLRVVDTLPLTDGIALAQAARDLMADTEAAQSGGREIDLQAPVLTVPNVLSASQCADLMRVWEEEGNQATGVEASTQGARGEQLQTKAKRRRDHVVTDPARTQQLAQTIGRRVMPELRKAFAYRATRFEGFKIACYEAEDRGFFSAHRDNLSPSTAHRRFALTLNLNEDFDGGQLRFPEYGADRYRPPAGAALLFSCSHLHEVLDVTAGRRFVLLSFLFADEPRQVATVSRADSSPWPGGQVALRGS